MGRGLQHRVTALVALLCHPGGVRGLAEKARGCFAPHSRRLRYAAPCFTRPFGQQQCLAYNRNWMIVGDKVRMTVLRRKQVGKANLALSPNEEAER